MKIFVSYSNDDISHVNSFNKIFNESNKIDSLFIASDKHHKDEYKKMTPGQNWKNEISRKIEESDAAILFLSKSFFTSEEVIDFELPLIRKKESNSKDYKIFPILVNEFKSINNSESKILSEQEFLNAQDTSLSSLRGGRYNLELQNISKRITANTTGSTRAFKRIYKNSRFLIFLILLMFGVIYFYQTSGELDTTSQTVLEQQLTSSSTTTTTEISIPYVNLNTLGIGDCVNLDFQNTDITDFKPTNVFLSNPVSCELDHDAEIINKFSVSRISVNELIFPGVFFGVFLEEDCYLIPDDDEFCDGVYIKEILSNSPAERTSLQSGDIITSVNGISTGDKSKFINYLSYISPNQKTTFTYFRLNQDGQIKVFDDVIIPDARIYSDGITSIINQTRTICESDSSLYGSLNISDISDYQKNLEKDAVFRTAISKPIFNVTDIEKDEFSVVCVLFIAEGKISNMDTDPIEFSNLKIIKNQILFGQEMYKEWGYFNVPDLYLSYNEFGQIAKTFFELDTGDCFDLTELNFNLNAENTNFITFENCSLQNQNAQIIGKFEIDKKELIDNEIFVFSNEFINYLDDKCIDLAFKIYKDEIWKGLASRYVDDSGIIIKGEMIRPLWSEVDDDISVKCSFSYTLGNGLERFRNVFDDSPVDNDIVKLSFSYCPKYVYSGTEYKLNQNTIPMEDVKGLSWIIPSWNTGKYPIEKFTFYTSNENVNFIGFDDLGVTLDPLDNDQYLFDGNKGVIPFMFEISNDYEGEIIFVVRADDVGGGNAWAECTTKVVYNASSNEILEINESGKISNNSWDSEISFKSSTEQKLNDIDLPLIKSIKNSEKSEQNSIKVELTKSINKSSIKNITVKYVLCRENSGLNCIDNHESEFNFFEYSYRKFNLLNEDEVLNTLEIPLYFYSCKNEYSLGIDYECFEEGGEIFSILEYIYINLGSPYECNIAYKGFTKNTEYLRETNPENTHIKFYKDILYGENQSNTDKSNYSEELCESLELSELPYTEDNLLYNYHYYPNFDFSSIFTGQLYTGAPVFEINTND